MQCTSNLSERAGKPRYKHGWARQTKHHMKWYSVYLSLFCQSEKQMKDLVGFKFSCILCFQNFSDWHQDSHRTGWNTSNFSLDAKPKQADHPPRSPPTPCQQEGSFLVVWRRRSHCVSPLPFPEKDRISMLQRFNVEIQTSDATKRGGCTTKKDFKLAAIQGICNSWMRSMTRASSDEVIRV